MTEEAAKAIVQGSDIWNHVERKKDGRVQVEGIFQPIELEAIGVWFKTNTEFPK